MHRWCELVFRWSNAEKKKVLITRPTLFQIYNQGMGGVDQIDQQIACYRTRLRQRKWLWPIFIYLFDETVVNAWHLTRQVHGQADSLLEFRHHLALTAEDARYAIDSGASSIATSS